MTAHLKSGTQAKEIPDKKSQAREVAHFIAQHNARNMPVIFGCDFNNKPNGPAHQAFYEALKIESRPATYRSYHGERGGRKGGYKVTSAYGKVLSKIKGTYKDKPTYRDVVGWEPPFTVDKVRKGGAQKGKIKPVKETIDFIFYTKEIECSRILEITNDDLEDCRIVGWRYPSDHFCIAADLTFKKYRRRRLVQAIDAHDN